MLRAIGFEELDTATVLGDAVGSLRVLEMAPETIGSTVSDVDVWVGARGGADCGSFPTVAFGSVARPEPEGSAISEAVVAAARPVAEGLGTGSCLFA